MTPAAFRAFLKKERLSQPAAAREIGVSPRLIWSYANGEKVVPLYIRLACAAYALGIRDYDGPQSPSR